MAARPVKLSGMQKQVLSLYRSFLRPRSKATEDRDRIYSVVLNEFRNNAKNVEKRNFVYIEYLLRRGKKQLEQLRDPGTKGLSSLKVGPAIPPKDVLDNASKGK